MKLKNYRPAKNEVLLEAKDIKVQNGIVLPNPQMEKLMKVVGIGPMTTATKIGDIVLMNSAPMAQIEATDEHGKKQIYLQGMEYNIMGYYTPEPGEKTYNWISIPESTVEEMPGPKNIIDNPGIEKSRFLQEQHEFQKNVD
jgi:hypothetical protein